MVLTEKLSLVDLSAGLNTKALSVEVYEVDVDGIMVDGTKNLLEVQLAVSGSRLANLWSDIYASQEVEEYAWWILPTYRHTVTTDLKKSSKS